MMPSDLSSGDAATVHRADGQIPTAPRASRGGPGRPCLGRSTFTGPVPVHLAQLIWPSTAGCSKHERSESHPLRLPSSGDSKSPPPPLLRGSGVGNPRKNSRIRKIPHPIVCSRPRLEMRLVSGRSDGAGSGRRGGILLATALARTGRVSAAAAATARYGSLVLGRGVGVPPHTAWCFACQMTTSVARWTARTPRHQIDARSEETRTPRRHRLSSPQVRSLGLVASSE